jgi:ADP-ribose pyrophosphatase
MKLSDKPNAVQLGWKMLKSSFLFRSKWYNLRQDTIIPPNASERTYTFVEHPGSVFIVPINEMFEIVLIRSFRYTIDQWCWEIPAGFCGDQPDMRPEIVARIELQEEIGAKPTRLIHLNSYFMSNGFANMQNHIFLATVTKIQPDQMILNDEAIDQIKSYPIETVRKMIREGIIADGDSALAILVALDYLSIHPLELKKK